MSEVRKDIDVQFTFLPREESGRPIPFYSGFRRQFHYDGDNWDAQFDHGDVPFAQPPSPKFWPDDVGSHNRGDGG